MQDAKSTTFTFGGVAIGGVESYSTMEGRVQESTYRPLDGSPPVSFPSTPDFGQCVLNLYADYSDAGQVALRSSLRNRTRATMVITHPDGTTETFTAFTLLFPSRGSKGAGIPVELTRCVLRVSGTIS